MLCSQCCIFLLVSVTNALDWISSANHLKKFFYIAITHLFLPSVPWHCWLGGRKGIWPIKNMGGSWRWALVSSDGVAPSQMVSVSASVNLPFQHKVQKFSSGIGSPGWSRKKGRKMVVVVVTLLFSFMWCGLKPRFHCHKNWTELTSCDPQQAWCHIDLFHAD